MEMMEAKAIKVSIKDFMMDSLIEMNYNKEEAMKKP